MTDTQDASQSELKHQLRTQIRRQRRAWVGTERMRAEEKICAAICQSPHIQRARWIGAYLAFDGEVNLSLLWGGGRLMIDDPEGPFPENTIETSHPLRSKLVFPRHQPGRPLSFVRPIRWVGEGALPLPEGPIVPLTEIEVLLIPGVAFCSSQGGRLGLGGGHYDRTLALRVNKTWSVKAFGVGFSFQQRSQLPLEPWDAQLDGLFTENGLLRSHE